MSLFNGLIADYNAAAGVTGSAPVTAVDDQSGAGNHITEVSGVSLITLDGRATFRFASGNYFALPASLEVDSRANSIFIVYRAPLGGGAVTYVLVSVGDGTNSAATLYLNSSKVTVHDGTTARSGTPPIYAGAGRTMAGIICGANGVSIIQGPERVEVAANASRTKTGGFVGKYCVTGTLPYIGDIERILIWNRAISDDELVELRSYCVTNYTVGSATSALFVFEGDSLTAGYKVSTPTPDNYILTRFGRLFSSVPKCYVLAATGDAIGANSGAGMRSQRAAGIDTILGWNPESRFTNRWVVLWGGTNDIAVVGSTGAQTQGYIEDFVSADGIKVVNPDAKVAVLGCLPRGSGDQTEYLALNSALAADHAWADQLVRIDLDSRLDDPADATYFDADKIHLNDAGTQVVAELLYAALKNSKLPVFLRLRDQY